MNVAFSENKIKYAYSFIPIIIFYFYFFYFKNNFPRGDDFNVILQTIIKFKSSINFKDIIYVIIEQNNEHRIVLVRVISILYFIIFGEINFIWLGFIGLLGLSVIFIFIFTYLKKQNLVSPSSVFMLAISIFSISFYENNIWAMASIQNYWILAFIVASFYFWDTFLETNKYHFLVYSILFFFLGTFTSGNGIFAGPIIVFHSILKKSIKNTIIWIIVTLIAFALYFYIFDYVKSYLHLYPNTIYKYIKFIFLFFSFFGKIKFLPIIYPLIDKIYILPGLVIFFISLIVLLIKFLKNDNFTFLLISFIILTLGILAYTRCFIGFTFASRYFIYQSILFFLLIISSKEVMKILKNHLFYVGGSFLIIINLLAFTKHYKKMYKDDLTLKTHYLNNNSSDSFVRYAKFKEYAFNILKESEKLNIFIVNKKNAH